MLGKDPRHKSCFDFTCNAFCPLLPQLLHTRIKFIYATMNVDSIDSNISQPHKKLSSDGSPMIPYALCSVTSNSSSTQRIDSSHETGIWSRTTLITIRSTAIPHRWPKPWRRALASILTCPVSHAVPESCDYSSIQRNCRVGTIFWYTDSTFIRKRRE